ncbi:MAG: glycosyltransferase family 2 protein [Bacteroidaceae bacterium]|nr:glycosyltransferase family 2 protein [Bacteroidaceae bacterium]
MRLSIIIPCYNAADTLRQCVQSILEQLPSETEVILVNDGSTDSTAQLADCISSENAAVRVFHKTNGGPSETRNYGISKACGDYLMFADSDDLVAPSTIPAVLSYMLQHPEVDVAEFPVRVHCGYTSEYQQNFPTRIWPSAREYWHETEAWEHTYAYNKVYRRQLFQKFQFPEGRIFEDLWFYSELLSTEPKVATLSCGLYLYRWNEKGLTVNADAEALQQLLEAQMRAARLMKTRLLSLHGWRLYRSMLYRQIDIYSATGRIQLHYPFVKLICILHKRFRKTNK